MSEVIVIPDNIDMVLEKIFNETSDNVFGVGIGRKLINNIETDELSIVATVQKKLPATDLSEKEMIPKEFLVDGVMWRTDVVQKNPLKLISCFPNTSQQPNDSFDSNDSNVLRLRGNVLSSGFLKPMRGGQQIVQYPSNWTPVNGGFAISVGTLGFFCKDLTDNKIIGVTNSHVLIKRRFIGSDRNLAEDNASPYNVTELQKWPYNSQDYPAGCVSLDYNKAPAFVGRIKRFLPVYKNYWNFADIALIEMNPSVISASDSFKIWQPTGTTEYPSPMAFATENEINNIFVSRPDIYSTGRTTGPKGWGSSSSCKLEVQYIKYVTFVYGTSDEPTGNNWKNCISFTYKDQSSWPVAGGDSGSALVADFSGTKKIIGLVFAGNSNQGIANSIVDTAKIMRLGSWDGSFNTSACTYNSVIINSSDPRIFDTKIVYNGKTYYQSGFTKTSTYPLVP